MPRRSRLACDVAQARDRPAGRGQDERSAHRLRAAGEIDLDVFRLNVAAEPSPARRRNARRPRQRRSRRRAAAARSSTAVPSSRRRSVRAKSSVTLDGSSTTRVQASVAIDFRNGVNSVSSSRSRSPVPTVMTSVRPLCCGISCLLPVVHPRAGGVPAAVRRVLRPFVLPVVTDRRWLADERTPVSRRFVLLLQVGVVDRSGLPRGPTLRIVPPAFLLPARTDVCERRLFQQTGPPVRGPSLGKRLAAQSLIRLHAGCWRSVRLISGVHPFAPRVEGTAGTELVILIEIPESQLPRTGHSRPASWRRPLVQSRERRSGSASARVEPIRRVPRSRTETHPAPPPGHSGPDCRSRSPVPLPSSP